MLTTPANTTLTSTTSPPPGWWRSRWRRLNFEFRAWVLRGCRHLRDLRDLQDLRGGLRGGTRPAAPSRPRVDDAPTERWPHPWATRITRLWTQRDAEERPLVAGKVHNLRVAAQRLDGVVLPAGQLFGFWSLVGRPVRSRGFVAGRELREGCLVASIGGGLCQLSNALYAVALDAGAEIVERHAHSQTVPGSQAEAGRDATVFWNYLDLRWRLPVAVQIEAWLDAERLVVRLRGLAPRDVPLPGKRESGSAEPRTPEPRTPHAHPLPPVSTTPGDCARCVNTRCVERTRADAALSPASPRHAQVLWARPWPEFRTWLATRALALPVREPGSWRVVWQRVVARIVMRFPAKRQAAWLKRADAQARAWAQTLPPEVSELVVPLDLLPGLATAGALQGRRYRVLMTRPPLQMLHAQLDTGAAQSSATSWHEYRASPARVAREWAALRGADALVTPHAALADQLRAALPVAVERLPWATPARSAPSLPKVSGSRLLFPASALARKGFDEVAAACRATGWSLSVLGRAQQLPTATTALDCHFADPQDPWREVAAVVLPAWVEQQPRWLLQALARGLPVVATAACGLAPGTPGWIEVPAGDPPALTRALQRLRA